MPAMTPAKLVAKLSDDALAKAITVNANKLADVKTEETGLLEERRALFAAAKKRGYTSAQVAAWHGHGLQPVSVRVVTLRA